MKKISIGIRTTPSVVYYAIVEEKEEVIEIKVADKLIIPSALIVPEQLKFIRNTFLDILNEFEVNLACIRVTESNAQTTNTFRIGIEAVVQELFASAAIDKYYVGQISNISSKLGVERDNFKPFVDGSKIFQEIEEWQSFKPESREAILAAFSAQNLI